jgi:hypothetical protein
MGFFFTAHQFYLRQRLHMNTPDPSRLSLKDTPLWGHALIRNHDSDMYHPVVHAVTR